MLAIDAILATLIVIFTIIPISIGPVRLAFLMLLPVLIACQIERFGTAIFAGIFLGVMSLVSALVMPTPLSGLFYNPLVSIFPRFMIAVIGWWGFKLISKLMNAIMPDKLKLGFTVSSILSAVLGVVTNTGLVVAMVWAFFNGKEVGGMIIDGVFVTSLLSINFVIELVACAIIVPPISFALKRALRQPLNMNGWKNFSENTEKPCKNRD